jgi:hypothetical protein
MLRFSCFVAQDLLLGSACTWSVHALTPSSSVAIRCGAITRSLRRARKVGIRRPGLSCLARLTCQRYVRYHDVFKSIQAKVDLRLTCLSSDDV